MKYYLAIDIGASSGRHIIGYYKDGKIETEEIYRFKNGVKENRGHLIWDIDDIFNQVKKGIKIALGKYDHIESMAIDTWGVDYVLLNGDKTIYPVYAYRDARTKNVIDKVHEKISFGRLYQITGSQFQEFNTIYQLYDDKLKGRLDIATSLLHIPEYLNYKLTGIKKHEYTNASTTGLLNLKTGTYSKEIIDKLELPNQLFTELYKPRTVVGDFKEDIQKEVKGNIKVVLCPTHDTASAVEGFEMKDNSLYLSSGTWSLLGLKSPKPINSEKAKISNYSNEAGPNYIRFQKNIMGLWIIQGLAKQMNLGFDEMVRLAKQSDFQEIFDVNDPMFLSTLDMVGTIQQYYKDKGMAVPKTDSDIILASYHSLAKSYQVAVKEIEDITNNKYDYLYIVGGGAKNQLLNELTEKYSGKKVIALPIEATALGNLRSQMEED